MTNYSEILVYYQQTRLDIFNKMLDYITKEEYDVLIEAPISFLNHESQSKYAITTTFTRNDYAKYLEHKSNTKGLNYKEMIFFNDYFKM